VSGLDIGLKIDADCPRSGHKYYDGIMKLPSIAGTTLIGLWLIAVGAGLIILMNYEYKPGTPGVPPVNWPAASKIKFIGKQATLVMVVHPHCTCTRASISELSQLMTKERGKLLAYVLFWSPPKAASGWEKTDLWRSASAIPGVTAITDENGVEANRFRAITSGQTMLYDRNGKLLFSGGITSGRGHVGDNRGLDMVEYVLSKEPLQQRNNLVFGCSLLTPVLSKR
jgi:hypothetical protein